MALLPGWQGCGLYHATRYDENGSLPVTTQPRLLPKQAAQAYADKASIHHAHVVVDPISHRLVWSSEKATGILQSQGQGIGVQPLDGLDGMLRERPLRFTPAVSRIGPGSITCKGYKRHY